MSSPLTRNDREADGRPVLEPRDAVRTVGNRLASVDSSQCDSRSRVSTSLAVITNCAKFGC